MCESIVIDVGVAVNKEMMLLGQWQGIETILVSTALFEKQSIYSPIVYLPTQFAYTIQNTNEQIAYEKK
jgi:hypothetical protein